MELTVISNFHFRRSHGGDRTRDLSILRSTSLTIRPRIHKRLIQIILSLQEDKIRDVSTIPYIHKCKCDNQLYFFAAVYGYKGLLVIFGLFLAWETRNVNLAVLNDSKYIGMFFI